VDDSERTQVSRVVDAPVERVFALLADPDRHPDIDGSGTLRSSHTHTVLTAVGEVFTMDLHTDDLGHYQTRSVVTSYEPDRAIGWAPGPVDGEPLGQTFTYTLDPEGADRTRVTETYDWSAVTDERVRSLCPRVSADDLARSLDLLAAML
jgi:uncharacterized protein YndB with AHSA1/START domain